MNDMAEIEVSMFGRPRIRHRWDGWVWLCHCGDYSFAGTNFSECERSAKSHHQRVHSSYLGIEVRLRAGTPLLPIHDAVDAVVTSTGR